MLAACKHKEEGVERDSPATTQGMSVSSSKTAITASSSRATAPTTIALYREVSSNREGSGGRLSYLRSRIRTGRCRRRLEPGSSIKGSISTARCGPCKPTRSEKCRRAASLQSPLTDSNRRPPPYHALRSATGRNPRQRFWLVSAVCRTFSVATGCHRLRPLGSINAPSRRLGELTTRGFPRGSLD